MREIETKMADIAATGKAKRKTPNVTQQLAATAHAFKGELGGTYRKEENLGAFSHPRVRVYVSMSCDNIALRG